MHAATVSEPTEIRTVNYFGDWGKHLGLLAVGWARHGGDDKLDTDPLRHLLELYRVAEEIFRKEKEKKEDTENDTSTKLIGIAADRDAFFRRLEGGEDDAKLLWQRWREVSISRYERLYDTMGIKFDNFSGEAQVPAEIIQEVEKMLTDAGVYETTAPNGEHADVAITQGRQINFDSAPAGIVEGKKKTLGTVISRFSNGTTSYLLRDIAAVVDRYRTYAFDRMLYVVPSEQHAHFQQVFTALDIIGFHELRQRLELIEFAKMEGLAAPEMHDTTLDLGLLEDIIEQCKATMKLAMEAVPDDFSAFDLMDQQAVVEKLAIFSLSIQQLSVKRNNVAHFDLNSMASPELENGISLMSWYIRLRFKIKTAGITDLMVEKLDYTDVEDQLSADLLRVLARFPDVAKAALASLEPSLIVSYLFRVIEQVSAIEDEEEDEIDDNNKNGEPVRSNSTARLTLLRCTAQVLETGMIMLGFDPVSIT
jgi:arginyl-tRNA synthetase